MPQDEVGVLFGRRVTTCLALTASMGACDVGERGPREPETISTTPSAVVYDNDDRREVFAHPDPVLVRTASLAAVILMNPIGLDASDPDNIQIRAGTLGDQEHLCAGEPYFNELVPGFCSGMLIDRDLVLTAGHCISDLEECQGTAFVFNFYYRGPGERARIRQRDVYGCRQLVAQSSGGETDFAVIQLDRAVDTFREPAQVWREDVALAQSATVSVISFPNGMAAKIDAGGHVVNTGAPNLEAFAATLDTFSGSSGAAVFDAMHRVVGTLVRGADDFVRRGSCWVTNVLRSANVGDAAEDVSYIARMRDALCASDFHSDAVCQTRGGWCRACADSSECPAQWTCERDPADEGVTWCSPRCTSDAECESDHRCETTRNVCVPKVGSVCRDLELWAHNACGRDVSLVRTCQAPNEVCFEGACIPPASGNSCTNPITIPATNQELTGTLDGRLSDDARGSCIPRGYGGGLDRVFRFELTARTHIEALATGLDTVLYIRRNCDDRASEIACNDDVAEGDTSAFLSVTIERGEYFLFLDSIAGQRGDYRLELTFDERPVPDAGLVDSGSLSTDAVTPEDATSSLDAGTTQDALATHQDATEPLPEAKSKGCSCKNGSTTTGLSSSGPAILGALLLAVSLRRGRPRRAPRL